MPPEPLDPLLSEEGWPHASLPPVEPGDPGRFYALFGRDSLITALQVLPERPEVEEQVLLREGEVLVQQPERVVPRSAACR